MARTYLDLAMKNIEFSRRYTEQLLSDVAAEEWFIKPSGSPTHLAWQMGHLAMAQYGLTMLRIRGKEPSDSEFITNDFLRKFAKGSQPSSNPADYPSVEEIRHVFQQVHERSLSELANYTDGELEVKLPEPHAVFDTKLGSIFFCSFHETMHAGQIGLMRRLLGKTPLR